jgi:hypothetical protein
MQEEEIMVEKFVCVCVHAHVHMHVYIKEQ